VAHAIDLSGQDILTYLRTHEHKDLLRFITCGSVDDGKSTLIGRLLYDTQTIYEDQLAAVRRDSERRGSAGGELDLSLLTDGLRAEREQGITIDVAYRYFATPRRKFIIADTPGHVQYTRNMITGASTADLALVLVDARQGLVEQSRRHLALSVLLGVPRPLLAVNKMDLVSYSEARYREILAEAARFVRTLGRDHRKGAGVRVRGLDLLRRCEHVGNHPGQPLGLAFDRLRAGPHRVVVHPMVPCLERPGEALDRGEWGL
jgi:small GTP-binding protein